MLNQGVENTETVLKTVCTINRISVFTHLIVLNPFSFCFPLLASLCVLVTVEQAGVSTAITLLMKGRWEIERKKTWNDRGRDRQVGRGGGINRDGDGTEWSKAKAYQIVPLLSQRTITYVFIVSWMHTGCLCLRTMTLWEWMGHTDHHSACIQENNIQKTLQTVESVPGASWYGPLRHYSNWWKTNSIARERINRCV